MELEEMKTLWEEMSIAVEKQKTITDSIIIKMTQTSFRNKMNRIWIPEILGSLVCLAEILYILINIQKLTPWYLLACGISAVVTLSLLILLSVKAIQKMRSVNISKINYKQSLLEYAAGKRQFVLVQKINFYLSAILLVVSLPVMGQLMGGKDLFKTPGFWIWYAVLFLFFYPLSRWLFKYYLKVTRDGEEILKELEG